VIREGKQLRVNDDALAPDRNSLETVSAEPAAATMRARVQAAVRRRLTAEHLLVVLLGLLVLVAHDVAYILRQPFWVDEAWVAITAKFPLSQLPATTDSTPIGWSVLLRVVSEAGTQTSRVLPLAFAGVAVAIAYWFGRRLGWRRPEASVAAGLAAGLGVLLVPALLVRDDLKQYTADACLVLLVLAVTSRVEREWSRPGLVALSVAVWGGMLFSHTVAFVGAAAFVAVCVVELARRNWRRLGEAVVAGVGSAILMLGVYEAFDARAVTPALTDSGFRQYYLPVSRGLHAEIAFVTSRFEALHAYFGLGPGWLAVPLVIAGLVTLFRLGRPATAITVAILWPEMLVLSALRKYPFLDLRTSTFLFAITVVVAAVGAIGVCSLVRPWLRGGIAAALAAAAVLLFAAGAQPYVRDHQIPDQDVRIQARYVAAHAAPADVILVNLSSNWGFAYYWPVGQPSRRPDAVVAQGYEAYFPGQPRIVVARGRDDHDVDDALSQALTLARQRSATRIWLVRTHLSAGEKAAWTAALRLDGLTDERVDNDKDDGVRVVPVR
jgi:hypothetical protein